MKFWEVMRLLEENPTKVYEAKLNCGNTARMRVGNGYYRFEIFDEESLIGQHLGEGAFSGNAGLYLDWHEVRQPVTWQEAIQAWVDGKTIKCEHGQIIFVYDPGDEFFGNRSGVHKRLFTNGKWYVEDSE